MDQAKAIFGKPGAYIYIYIYTVIWMPFFASKNTPFSSRKFARQWQKELSEGRKSKGQSGNPDPQVVDARQRSRLIVVPALSRAAAESNLTSLALAS